jgi:hypothetical protein
MGGLGSGRNPETFTVERTPALDIALLDDGGALDEPGREGEFTWQSRPVEDFEFRFVGDALVITEPFEQRVPIIVRETPSGTAEYPLFRCPRCSRPRRKLYLKPLSWDTFSCRSCLGLVYKRSRLSGSPRRVGAYNIAQMKRELDELEQAAASPESRRSPKRRARIEQLKDDLAAAQEAQNELMWQVVDQLRARFKKLAGYDPMPGLDGLGLDVSFEEPTAEEVHRAVEAAAIR